VTVIGWALIVAVQGTFALAIITIFRGAARRSDRHAWAGIGWGVLGIAGLALGSAITPFAGLLLIAATAVAAWRLRDRIRRLDAGTTSEQTGPTR
jgi:hypothetical protein